MILPSPPLARTNVIENIHGNHPAGLPQRQTLADGKMVLRWTGAAMLEAAKGFRRLKARKQLPIAGGTGRA